MKIEYYEDMLEQEAINKYLNMIANDYNGELAKIFQEKYINKDKEIKRLEVENRELSEGYNEEFKENVRLNNIINELEKELKEDYKIWMCNSRSSGKSVKFGIDVCKTHFYNRLQKLKGDKSNETNK